MNTSKFNAVTAIRRIAEQYELSPSELSALKIGRKPEKQLVLSPEDCFAILAPKMTAYNAGGQEHLIVVLLSSRNNVIDVVEIYKGSLNTSMVRISEIFKPAIVKNAAAIIVAHNHPSGDPSPSPEDVALTKAMFDAGKLLEIELFDHLVIGDGRFVSLKSVGLFPTPTLAKG